MNLRIRGRAVDLEAALWEPENRLPRGAVVLCHPHPVYGGSMDNRVVYRCAKACLDADLAALRFNFRGVGTSTGSYDHGEGEKEDVEAAIDYLEMQYRALPLVLIGFSFGAWVGLQAGCQDSRITAMVGLGLPIDFYDFDFLLASRKPTLLLAGTEDEVCPRESMNRLAERMPSCLTLRWIEGTDHFFGARLEEVQACVTDYLRHSGGALGEG